MSYVIFSCIIIYFRISSIILHPKIMHTPRLAERGEFRREEPGCQAGRVIKKPAGGRAASSRNLPAKPAGHPSSLDLPVPVITLGNCCCRSGHALTVPKSPKFHTVLRVHERRRVIFKDLSSGAVTLKITKVPKATARVLTTLTTLISFGSNQLYCAHMLYYLQVTTIISELKEYSE